MSKVHRIQAKEEEEKERSRRLNEIFVEVIMSQSIICQIIL
jgi:hypothetical protein